MKSKIFLMGLLVLASVSAQAQSWQDVQEKAHQASEAIKETAVTAWENGKSSGEEWLKEGKDASADMLDKAKDSMADHADKEGKGAWRAPKIWPKAHCSGLKMRPVKPVNQ